jgi:ABC-type phosphate transport system substrate-binding protein
MKFIKSISLMLAIIACFGAGLAQADVVVVVSAKSAVGSLTADEVSQLFLGKIGTFPSGSLAVPIDQSEGTPARGEFYTKVTGKDAAQVKAYWSKLVFTGKGQPPKEVPGNAEVKKLVADNPNMIGYIDKSAADGSVKIILAP